MHRRRVAVPTIAFLILAAPLLVAAQRNTQAAQPSAAAAQVNLNTATAVQLDSLPGVGPALAERIIEYRQKNGGFKKIEELMNVRGIGEKSFLKLKDLIAVTQPKTDKGGAAAN